MAHLTNFSFDFVSAIFTEDGSLLFLYHGAKNAKNDQNSNQGVLPYFLKEKKESIFCCFTSMFTSTNRYNKNIVLERTMSTVKQGIFVGEKFRQKRPSGSSSRIHFRHTSVVARLLFGQTQTQTQRQLFKQDYRKSKWLLV